MMNKQIMTPSLSHKQSTEQNNNRCSKANKRINVLFLLLMLKIIMTKPNCLCRIFRELNFISLLCVFTGLIWPWHLYNICHCNICHRWSFFVGDFMFVCNKINHPQIHNRPIYIGKNQNPKNLGFFVVPFTLPEKPITFGVFGTKSAYAKKPESGFGKWCACATSLYLWPYVVRITSLAAVGWFRRSSRTTWPKTWIIPARLEQAFTLAKTLKNRRIFKKSHSGGGFSIRVFCSV